MHRTAPHRKPLVLCFFEQKLSITIVCFALAQFHAHAAPPIIVPLPPPSEGEEGLECAGWGVREVRINYPMGSNLDCPMGFESSGSGEGRGTCTSAWATKPTILACASGMSNQSIDQLRAAAEVRQVPRVPFDLFWKPCLCEGDSPDVFLVGKRSSVIYSTPGTSSGARTFTVRTRGRVSLKSILDITADCDLSSCAGVNGHAEWRMSIPLTNTEAIEEMQLNGRRLERVSGIGFCTAQTTVSGGFEIGTDGVGAQWSYDVGGTVARAKKTTQVAFRCDFCISADAARYGLVFEAEGTVLGQAWLDRGTEADVRTEVDLFPVKITFKLDANGVDSSCGSCVPDSPWSPVPTSTGGDGAL